MRSVKQCWTSVKEISGCKWWRRFRHRAASAKYWLFQAECTIELQRLPLFPPQTNHPNHLKIVNWEEPSVVINYLPQQLQWKWAQLRQQRRECIWAPVTVVGSEFHSVHPRNSLCTGILHFLVRLFDKFHRSGNSSRKHLKKEHFEVFVRQKMILYVFIANALYLKHIA